MSDDDQKTIVYIQGRIKGRLFFFDNVHVSVRHKSLLWTEYDGGST